MASLDVADGRYGPGSANGSGGPGGRRPSVPGRAILRRRTLPGGRAVAGGFLIAAAAVLTFAAYTRATRTPHQLYVVAARPLAPGTRLGADDLTLVPLDLPDPGVRRQVFGSTASLLGASIIAPVNAGALVESSEVVGRSGGVGSREISLSLDRSRAVGGTLKPGEHVDVLGTFGGGAESYTAVMVPHVSVLSITGQGGSLGDSRTELIVLSVPDGVAAEAVADANVATQVTLVRSAEQPDSAPVTTVPAYRAPGTPPAPASSAPRGVSPGTGGR